MLIKKNYIRNEQENVRMIFRFITVMLFKDIICKVLFFY